MEAQSAMAALAANTTPGDNLTLIDPHLTHQKMHATRGVNGGDARVAKHIEENGALLATN